MYPIYHKTLVSDFLEILKRSLQIFKKIVDKCSWGAAFLSFIHIWPIISSFNSSTPSSNGGCWRYPIRRKIISLQDIRYFLSCIENIISKIFWSICFRASRDWKSIHVGTLFRWVIIGWLTNYYQRTGNIVTYMF